MTPKEIIAIVEDETGLQIIGLRKKNTWHVTLARYAAILMMHEEGVDRASISAALDADRATSYKALEAIEVLLEAGRKTKMSKDFKKMYLACNARRCEIEETEEITNGAL